MGHYTWKNGSHLEKWVKFKNMGQFKKWFTRRKMDHKQINGQPLKMGHIWRIGSHVGSYLKKWITRKNKVTRTKYFTFGKMGQTWQNGSHLGHS